MAAAFTYPLGDDHHPTHLGLRLRIADLEAGFPVSRIKARPDHREKNGYERIAVEIAFESGGVAQYGLLRSPCVRSRVLGVGALAKKQPLIL